MHTADFVPPTSPRTSFRTVTGDPIHVKMHTLANGLKLFLSINHDEPRVHTEIEVRAGSKHDPADTTGLAHYFEHMMFKGTDRLGSLDWEREKPLLDKIEALFEEHRAEQNEDQKKVLYAEIDRLSFEAAKLAAANEYDKLVSAIGAKHTNAYTWLEQTVYVNDIPANELERWFALESERFRRPVLRLFHTELETVFEEYNISQDRDARKVMRAMQEILTPTHPYGTQTTLGRGEDLKNPSQTNIYKFFDRYYVPNNLALVLCGDFDPDAVVAMAEQYFGHYPTKEIPPFTYEEQPELKKRTQRDVRGTEAAWLEMAWNFPGAATEQARMLPLLAGILYNGQAGLFDLDLIQQQQVLEASAFPRIHEDYCSMWLYAKPREGQTLEELEKLLLGEVEKLRRGQFEDWLPAAVIKDLKLAETRDFERNQGRAAHITQAFVLGLDWKDYVQRWDVLGQVTKAEVVEFAQQFLRDDNYGVVFKNTGEDNSVMKVEKPSITAIEVNRVAMSHYAEDFLDKTTPDIQPQFLDFKKIIATKNLAPNLKLRALRNPDSRLFRLDYIFEMGKNADRRFGPMSGYVNYLGTSQYSAVQMQQAFFQYGVHFSATCQDERFYFTLTGLEESFEAGVELMEHLLADAQPNKEALANQVADILQRRENYKLDKRTVLNKAMLAFAKYGVHSPYQYKLSREELLALDAAELTKLLRDMPSYRHEVFYYGPKSANKAAEVLKQYHVKPNALRKTLPNRNFRERGQRKDEVFFVNFPSVQVELLLLSKGAPKFSFEEFLLANWYNQYFGSGLSSIVFQDLREAKGLAYHVYAVAMSPQRKNRAHFLQAFVGTQPDKLHEAVSAFQTILEEMPVSMPQIETARQSVLKQIAAERIVKADVYWAWRNSRDKGFANRDLRKDVYETLQSADAETLLGFQNQRVKGRHYTWMVLGERERLDFKYLKKIGKVKELTLEEIFGY